MRRVLVALALLVVGCSGTTKVGNSTLLTIPQKAGGGFDTTTTLQISGTLPPAQTPRATTTLAPHVTVRTTTTLTPAQRNAITAHITISGASTDAFVPSLQTVYPGTPVQWTNHDTVARSVVSDDETSFSSGPIAPGASYTWAASGSPRQINYHDGTRPYAVGTLQLVPRP